MENTEELVSNETENVEELATEELVDGTTEPITEEVTNPVKTYTDEEVDEIVKKRLYRQEQKLNRDFQKQLHQYKEAEAVLNAGLGTSNIEDATNNLRQFYADKGIEIPKYSIELDSHSIEVLANDDANTIIDSGYDDIVEETDRLAKIGLENMSARDKIVFQKLASKREEIENEKEIASLGVSKDELNSDEFKSFVSKLNPNMSLKEKYDFYVQMKPKKQIEQMGSMKNMNTNNVKDYYTPEEARRLTDKELSNPEVMKAVENSMTIWYQKNIQ